MEATLSHTALYYLWNHRVAGRALFPAAAMLEAAAAATAAMLSAATGALSAQAVLTDASIPAPLVLPSAAEQTRTAVCLEVTVLARSGTLEVASASRGRQVHLRAAATCMLVSDAAAVLAPSQQVLSAIISGALSTVHKRHSTAAVAVASMAQNVRQPGGQYLIHPAVIDNCTQAGAAHASPGDAPAVTRVPAGLRACAIRGRLASAEAFASAAVMGLLADGTAVSDYGLVPATGGSSAMAISGMLFKPVSRGKGEAPPVPAPAISKVSAQDAMYELCWAVTAPGAAPPGLPAQHRPALTWTAMSAGGVKTATSRLAIGESSSALAGSMRFIQARAAAASAKAASVQLHTSAPHLDVLRSCAGVSQHWSRAALTEAGASGLLRVAAQEISGTSWQHYAGSSAASDAHVQPADAFGVCSSRNLSLAPRLQPSQAAGSAHGLLGHQIQLIGESIIVTGGLGDIGSLSGTWVAEASQGAHIFLIGRSGRAAHIPPQALLSGTAAVHVVRCDAAQSCEVDALLHAVRCGGPPLRSVMHAGGVLQDAMLPKQVINLSNPWQNLFFDPHLQFKVVFFKSGLAESSTAVSGEHDQVQMAEQNAQGMRAAAAPKLVAAQRLAHASSGEPVQACTLYSSLSALLGTAGQANYAAANAQLNTWAELQQSSGDTPSHPSFLLLINKLQTLSAILK